jgi:N-acetyl-anhydromuramyl-L-alanine amidase AmpD
MQPVQQIVMPGRGTAIRAGVAAVALSGLALATAAAGARVTAAPGPVAREYAEAARVSGVPAPLLVAVGYANTRWRMPAQPSPDGGVGPMHLRPRALRSAASLAGIAPRRAARIRALNIRAGALLLRRLAGGRPGRIEAWYPALERLGGPVFAADVYAVIASGAGALVGRETVVLRPRRLQLPRRLSAAGAGPAEYPGALWRQASRANFQPANRPASSPILRIVVHVTQGSYGGTIRWFRNPYSRVSTHYVVRSSDGQVTQMLAEKDIGWHSGNSYYNATTIGIEHEAYVSNCSWFTDAMYRGSARLVAYLALKYALPIDRAHIIGHNEVPDPSNPRLRGGSGHHTDPGPCWDWTKYMALVRAYAGRSDEAVVDDRASGRFSAPGWRRRSESPQRFGPGYVLARPSATAAPATFKVRVPVAGDYAVYGWWPAYKNRNPATPVEVETAAGVRQTVVDQRANGRRWVLLGTFRLRAGLRSIRFSRKATKQGWISADAVKVEPLRPLATGAVGLDATGWALTARALSTTRNGGGAWQQFGPPGVPASRIRALDLDPSQRGRLVALAGAGLELYSTTDGGTTWTESALPLVADLDAAAPIGLDFLDDSTGFASLRRENRGEGVGVLLRTIDGGVTWRSSKLPVPGTVRFRTPTDGWLENTEGLYVTHDGGRRWRATRLPKPRGYAASIAVAGLPTFTDEFTGVLPMTLAGKKSAVSFLASDDGGFSWRVAAVIPTARPLIRAQALPTTVVDATTWLAALEGGRRLVLVSDGGERQTRIVPRSRPFGGSKPPVAQLRFASATNGWAQIDSRCPLFHGRRCAGTQKLYRTADGGATWQRLTPP